METTYASGPRELQMEGVEAESFEALAEIALEALRAQGASEIVCGPITTGGTNHQILNFEIFNATIVGLLARGRAIFNQMPYEFGLRRLTQKWEMQGNKGYCTPILTVFYATLFESGYITQGWFIPGWRLSFGARYEREKLTTQKVSIVDLTLPEIHAFMEQRHDPAHVTMVMNLLR